MSWWVMEKINWINHHGYFNRKLLGFLTIYHPSFMVQWWKRVHSGLVPCLILHMFMVDLNQCYWENTRLSTHVLITYQLITDFFFFENLLITYLLGIEFSNFNNLSKLSKLHQGKIYQSLNSKHVYNRNFFIKKLINSFLILHNLPFTETG